MPSRVRPYSALKKQKICTMLMLDRTKWEVDMRHAIVFFVLLNAFGCATTRQEPPELEQEVRMTFQIIDNQCPEVRVVTFERFQDNGVRLAHPEPILSLTVPPGAQAGLLLKSGNYKFSIFEKRDGKLVPIMDVPSMISGKETVFHIGPTG